MLYRRVKVNPVSAAWNTVARFAEHAGARSAADRPSGDGHPGQHPGIVGTDPIPVERVSGRLITWRAAAAGALSGRLITWRAAAAGALSGRLITWRAAAAGALSGLWAGLLTGILFGLFTAGNVWVAMLVAGLGLAVLCGATFAIAAHLAIRGQRSLGSPRGLPARHDGLIAREGGAERARNAPGQAGLPPPDTPPA